MKKGVLYLWVLLVGLSCTSNDEATKGTFPDNLVNKKSSQHQRVLGTNLLAIIPSSYKFVNPFRYVKSENEFIILSKLQMPFKYQERKSALEVKDPEAETLRFKELTFNNLPALFRESVIVDKNQHFYLLNYGDDANSYMLLSQCNLDSAESRDEMLSILKSICVDEDVEFDPLETATFAFDESITNFKIAKVNINDYRYTADGKYLDNNKIVNSILVNEMGPSTQSSRIQLMEYWSKTYLKSKIYNTKNNWKETKIGEYDALEFETDFSLNGVDGKVYFVILSDPQQRTMKFTGIAFDEINNHINKYKETVKTIKFK